MTNNVHPTSQPQLDTLPDPVAESIPSEIRPIQTETKHNEVGKTEPENLNHDSHAYTNGQNSASTWNDGQGNDGHDNYGDIAVEEESRGIGIKEDG